MLDAHVLPAMQDLVLRNGFSTVGDPGASGTISINGKGDAICEVVTAAAESRVLPSATDFPVGQSLMVAFVTDGGDLTITGSADGTVTMTEAGDLAVFKVSRTGSTKVWKTVFESDLLSAQGAITAYLPLTSFRVWDAMATNLPAVAAANNLGLVTGTFLTDQPYITTGNVNATTATRRALAEYKIPENYQAGSPLTVYAVWSRVDAAQVTATIDAEFVKASAPTVDLTGNPAPTSVNGSTAGVAQWPIIATTLLPGDLCMIRMNLAMDDTAGGGSEVRLTGIAVGYTIA
jgi:hypothetical protein